MAQPVEIISHFVFRISPNDLLPKQHPLSNLDPVTPPTRFQFFLSKIVDVNVVVPPCAAEWNEEEEPEGFTLRGDQSKVAAANAADGDRDGAEAGASGDGGGGADGGDADAAEDVDDFVIMEDGPTEAAAETANGKRKRGGDDDDDGGGGGGGGGKTVRLD